MPQPITITEDELAENYKYWISQWNPLKEPDNNLRNVMSLLFPTHTFGFIKTINGATTFPYKRIFGIGEEPQGLLSDAYREENNLYEVNEIRRTMNAARVVGLNNYVFAYLSIHDPYYGRPSKEDSDMNARPFGIFINKDIENLPECLPSRRDVNIYRQTEMATIRREFLNPLDSRSIGAHQIINDTDHAGDFWHYYGSPNFYQDMNYSQDAWKKRLEYHYLGQVTPKDIAAVIWPKWFGNAPRPGVKDYDLSYYAIPEINSTFPNTKVITYDWDEADPEMCFLEASYYTTKYLLKYQEFPESAEIAKNDQ